MLRKWAAVLLIVMLTAAGCRSPQPANPTPAPPAAPAFDPCRGPVTEGPPAMSLETAEIRTVLPLASCGLRIAAGKLTLILNPGPGQEDLAVAVTGAAGAGHYRWETEVKQGETRTITFDLKEFGRTAPVTYTLVGETPALPFLASGPARQDPWTPVPGSGLIPASHTWLRFAYPMVMKAGGRSPLGPGRYLVPGEGLPGQWEGDRLQYVEIGSQPPVLSVGQTAEANGLQIWVLDHGMIYRGDPPELHRIQPGDGSAKTVYRFTADIPGRAVYKDGVVTYQTGQNYMTIDPATGKTSPGQEPAPFKEADQYRFPSPDGKLVAELLWDKPPDNINRQPGQYTADLIIREQATGKTLVKHDRWLTSQGFYGCSNPAPGFAWRPDSRGLAVLDAPDKDRLVLKEADLKGTTRTIAERKSEGAGTWQFHQEVSWSPDGRLIVFGPQLVEAATGKLVADKLSEHTFWSPDGKYLLLYQPNNIFVRWGEVGLLEVAGGSRRTLGGGIGLGWTKDGVALIIRWDVGKQIPGPGKGCI